MVYRYPTICGSMKGEGKIESIVCGIIKFKNSKYNFKLDKFEYIVIKHVYKKLYPEKIIYLQKLLMIMKIYE